MKVNAGFTAPALLFDTVRAFLFAPARALLFATVAVTLVSATGCRSRFIDAVIINQGNGPVRNLQVDYPSATFGVSQIDPGQQFHYRFKIQGAGTAKITFTDPAGHSHQNTGFQLREGQEGTMTITVYQNGDNVWAAGLGSDHATELAPDTSDKK